MNIGIDVNCLIFEKAGFGRYTYNLVKNLLKIDQKNHSFRRNHFFLYASFIRQRNERKKILEDLIKETKAKNVTVRIIPIPARWKEFLIGLPISIKHFIKDPLDVYFAPHFAGIPKKGFDNKVRMIVTIHDLVFQKFPEHRGRKLSNYYLKRTKIALEQAKTIIAVSNSTKKDIQQYFKLKNNRLKNKKIVVIPEAVTENFKVCKNNQICKNNKVCKNKKLVEEKTNKYIPRDTQFILSVGTLEPRKNLSLIIKAFALLPNNLKKEYKIVFTGGAGWNNKILTQTIKNYNLESKVIFTGFAEESILPYIYNRASVFIYPSLYEGFGLPPLEAMASGTPVIASNCSSLPEVIGSAGILIDPKSEEELASAIKKILLSPKLAHKLSLRGLKQAKKFSWEKVARKTLEVLEKSAK